MFTCLLIFIILATLVFLLALRIPIGSAILLTGLLLWFIINRQFETLYSTLLDTLQNDKNWQLLAVLCLIWAQEKVLKDSKLLPKIAVTIASLLKSPKLAIAFIPAFLGILPSLGGARFSAPLVQELAPKNASSSTLACINFWFRHVFNYCNPLISGTILACTLASISMSSLLSSMLWIALLAFALGWFFLIAPLPHFQIQERLISPEDKKISLILICSIAIVFVSVLLFNIHVLYALLLAFVLSYVSVNRKQSITSFPFFLWKSLDFPIILTVASILYFGELLKHLEFLELIASTATQSLLPTLFIIGATALILGLITGLSQSYVALLVPVTTTLYPDQTAVLALVLFFGMSGQMLTPTHLCLVVSIDAFKTSFFPVLKKIFVMQTILSLAFSLVFFYQN